MKRNCTQCNQVFLPETDAGSVTNPVCPACERLSSESQMPTQISPGANAPETHPVSNTLHPGKQIGRFEVQSFLGRGGFGSVYLAFDPHLKRKVAIKLPRTEKLTEGQIASMVSEAQITARLRHPNIVAVHEVLGDDKTVYIVSDVIEGETLSAWLKHNRPTVNQAVKWSVTLARALHHAHQAGIVHRDFKPGNVMLDSSLEPCITDFGLALQSASHPDSTDSTRKLERRSERTLVGTPAYMPPEQAAGMGNDATAASDVYSLGVVLFEMLAGRRPFLGDSSEITRQTLFNSPPRLRSLDHRIPKPLDAIVHKALAKSPTDRFASAQEFAEELERFLAGEPTLTLPPNWWQSTGRTLHLNRRALGVGLGLSVILLVAIWGAQALDAWFANRCLVRVVTDPPGAQIAIVPLEHGTGRLLTEQKITPATRNDYPMVLAPGWYLIEAYHPKRGVQEVFRLVTKNRIDYQTVISENDYVSYSSCRCLERIEDDGRLVLPTIRITSFADGRPQPNESLVAGGQFVAGSDEMEFMFPRTEVSVNPFWMETSEVTLGRFLEVMGRPPERLEQQVAPETVDPRSPVGYVTYFDALEFAERTGKRLPTLEEYWFASTNGGTTVFPWGDEPSPEPWDLMATSPPDNDRTQHQPPIRGLFSRVAEWTQSAPPKSPVVPEGILLAGGVGSRERYLESIRILAGGTATLVRGLPRSEWDLKTGPREPMLEPIYADPSPGMGLRCVRSQSPRFLVPTEPSR